jgi:hypothetical protein
MRHPRQAQRQSGSKSTRSASSRTGLLRASRLAVAGRHYVSFPSLPATASVSTLKRDTAHSERRTASAARRRARPTKPPPPRAHTATMIRVYDPNMYAPRPTLFPDHPCRTPHRLWTWQVVRKWLVIGWGIFDAVTAQNVEPTSTGGSDSGAQLTSLSLFNRVCKLQQRGAPMSPCHGALRVPRSTNAPLVCVLPSLASRLLPGSRPLRQRQPSAPASAPAGLCIGI